MLDPLREIFNYHSWATFTIIDHLATLPAETLDASVPGTAGTILDTLTHLVRADRMYLSLMYGEGRLPRDDHKYTLSELRDQFASQMMRWADVLNRIDEFDPGLEREANSEPVDHVRNLLLTQAIHHGNDHRTHICTILGARELAVPEIDEWAYWFSPGHQTS